MTSLCTSKLTLFQKTLVALLFLLQESYMICFQLSKLGQFKTSLLKFIQNILIVCSFHSQLVLVIFFQVLKLQITCTKMPFMLFNCLAVKIQFSLIIFVKIVDFLLIYEFLLHKDSFVTFLEIIKLFFISLEFFLSLLIFRFHFFL